jgi:hypothetical protein
LATPVRAFIPDVSSGLASPDQCLVFIDFVFAYSNLEKTEYTFVRDVHLVLAKLGQHLVLDGSECIDFGIDTPLR